MGTEQKRLWMVEGNRQSGEEGEGQELWEDNMNLKRRHSEMLRGAPWSSHVLERTLWGKISEHSLDGKVYLTCGIQSLYDKHFP